MTEPQKPESGDTVYGDKITTHGPFSPRERLLRDPEIVIDRDADVSALIADHLRRHPEVETVPRGAFLMLWALYRKAVES